METLDVIIEKRYGKNAKQHLLYKIYKIESKLLIKFAIFILPHVIERDLLLIENICNCTSQRQALELLSDYNRIPEHSFFRKNLKMRISRNKLRRVLIKDLS